ncbi:hypothetical protein L9F63_027431, partial [Diploptera punctata]
ISRLKFIKYISHSIGGKHRLSHQARHKLSGIPERFTCTNPVQVNRSVCASLCRSNCTGVATLVDLSVCV